MWVGPALARQWDDRQAARELQVALVESVLSATARVDADLLALALTRQPRRSTSSERAEFLAWVAYDKRMRLRLDKILSRWRVERTKVGTRLRVYYGDDGADLWRKYENAVGSFATLARLEATTPDGQPNRAFLQGGFSTPPQEMIATIVAPEPTDVHVSLLKSPDKTHHEDEFDRLAAALSRRAQTLIDLIVDEEPDWFSTSRRDLLNDLLP